MTHEKVNAIPETLMNRLDEINDQIQQIFLEVFPNQEVNLNPFAKRNSIKVVSSKHATQSRIPKPNAE
jgi:hypothetical protein